MAGFQRTVEFAKDTKEFCDGKIVEIFPSRKELLKCQDNDILFVMTRLVDGRTWLRFEKIDKEFITAKNNKTGDIYKIIDEFDKMDWQQQDEVLVELEKRSKKWW